MADDRCVLCVCFFFFCFFFCFFWGGMEGLSLKGIVDVESQFW